MTVPTATGGTTGALTQVHSYDAMGRRVQAVSTDTSKPTGQQSVGTLTRHYSDTSDNPGWTVQTEPDPASPATTRTTQTRYLGGLGGGLTMTATKTSVATGSSTSIELMLANLHGDIAATTQLHPNGTALEAAIGIDTWNDTDEYGNVRPSGTSATSAEYGWHGTAERSTATPALLTLMGARLYNPVTGLFLSSDPVYGGNDTSFAYPSDPVNSSDLDGKLNWKKWAKKALRANMAFVNGAKAVGRHLRKNWKRYAQAAVFAACVVASAGACLAAGVAYAAVNLAVNVRTKGWNSKTRREFGGDMVGAVLGFGIGKYAVNGGRFAARHVTRYVTKRFSGRVYSRAGGRHGRGMVIQYGRTLRNYSWNAAGSAAAGAVGTAVGGTARWS